MRVLYNTYCVCILTPHINSALHLYNTLAYADLLYINLYLYIGSIPDILCAMPNLQHLNLSSNQLSGYIIEDLGDLTNLITLELQNNKFSGYIPYSIRGLVKVQVINLSQNQLCGAVPDCLDQLIELRELYAYENKLSGKLLYAH